MLHIYGSAKSRTLRVLWMAGELGIPYKQKDWLPRAPETRTPEFYALNPNGRVPVIDDDGLVLWESRRSACISRRSTTRPIPGTKRSCSSAACVDPGRWPHVQASFNRCRERSAGREKTRAAVPSAPDNQLDSGHYARSPG